MAPLVDPLNDAAVNFARPVVPVIDNDAPGGIIYGRVLRGDNSPIAGAQVHPQLDGKRARRSTTRRASTTADFLFEYVPRDIDDEHPATYLLSGADAGRQDHVRQGAVRLPGRVHFVNLVFLGRGSAEGCVTYDNGESVPKAKVVVGSTMFDQFREHHRRRQRSVLDRRSAGRSADLQRHRRCRATSPSPRRRSAPRARSSCRTCRSTASRSPAPATIRGIVIRSDTNAPVAGAHVGVYTRATA